MKRLLVCLMLVVILIGIAGCGGPSIDTSSPETLAKSVLKEPKDSDDSGFIRMIHDEKSTFIEYRFFPAGITDLKKEIGVELAQKIKTLYEAADYFDVIHFQILLPYEDKYGNIQWRPTVRFTMDRETYSKINWENFSKQKLLDVAKDIQGIN